MANRDLQKLALMAIAAGIISGLLGGLIGARLFMPSASQPSTPNISAVSRATVTIRARQNISESQTAERLGVGVAVGNGDQIVTNAHIVQGASELYVKLASGQEVKTNVIKQDSSQDLALLKADGLSLRPPVFAGSSDLKVGQKVYALGKPFINSNNFTLTSGIISALPIDLPKGSPTLMQTDAVINPGNSGGPLIDNNGRVIGITTAYLSTGENIAGIGFAIPIDEVLKFIEN